MGYYIVNVDTFIREIIDKSGKPNKYGEPKIFNTKEDAEKWISKRTYKGMTHHYEVKEAMVK